MCRHRPNLLGQGHAGSQDSGGDDAVAVGQEAVFKTETETEKNVRLPCPMCQVWFAVSKTDVTRPSAPTPDTDCAKRLAETLQPCPFR